MKPFPNLALLSAALLAAAPSRATLPWPKGAEFAKGAVLEVAGYAGSSTLAGFPVLVRIAERDETAGTGIAGFSYADVRNAAAADPDDIDIGFTDMQGNGLPYEIDTWDPAGESLVWVRLPEMANGTQFVMCWGSDSSGKDVCNDNPWSDYTGVWHMNETTAGVTTIHDSTANGLDGTSVATSDTKADGAVGRARFITSNTENKKGKPYDSGVTVDMTDDPDKLAAVDAIVPEFTASFWVRPQNDAQWWYFITRKAADLNPGWGLQNGSDGNNSSFKVFRAYGSTETDSQCMNLTGVNGLVKGTWTKIDAVWMADKAFKLYVNGILAKEGTLANAAENGDQTKLGIGGSMAPPPLDQNLGNNHKNGRGVYGDMDEVRLAAGAATADRIAADYATVTNRSFLSAGAVEPYDAGAPELGTPTLARNADGTFTVTVEVSANDAAPGTVKCVVGAAEFPLSSSGTSLPKTYSGTISGLEADTTFSGTVQAESATGTVVLKPLPAAFHTGDLSVAKLSDANEAGLVPGAFRITRADAAGDLAVNYTLAGTAVAGRTYRALSGTVTIPAGATFADVAVVPLLDDATAADSTVVLALAPGLYGIAASAASASLTIENAEINVWSASAAGLASVAGNWSLGHAPLASELALFDGAVSQADCEWDEAAPRTVAGWTQAASYTGTVTLCTVFPGKGAFTNLVVAGEMVVDGGFLTHPQSRTMDGWHVEDWDWLGDLKANETYRIRVSAGSLHVGAGGAIDARGKGYHITNGGCRILGCSHGGRVGETSPPCYGDPREPIHIGLPFHPNGTYLNGKGGGAIYLDVAGAAVVDGTIRADAWDGSIAIANNQYAGAMGAAGSVFLRADTLAGTGRITAMGTGPSEEGLVFLYNGTKKSTETNYKGTGGRVAISTRVPVDRSTFAAISAEGYWMGSPDATWSARFGGGSGTVVFRDATRPNGLLVIAQQANAIGPDLGTHPTFWRCPSVTDEGDWTFDAIEFGHRGFLRVPVGTTLTLPGGLASCYGTETDPEALGGLRYEGGALNIGAGDQTIAGSWMFAPWTNFVFQGSVAVSNNAAIGFHPLTGNVDNSDTLAIFPVCSFEVRGDLTVTSDSWLRATDCGFVKESLGATNGVLGATAHGGRALFIGRDESGAPLSRAYDSVFDPRLPGCTADATRTGGGAIVCRVDGTFRLDGTAIASGLPETRVNSGSRTGGAGGAINVTAGRLAGAGAFKASGGNYNDRAGPGGRIAVRLTATGADFTNFTGRIEAGGGSWWKGGTAAVCDASAGTVYLETAADGDRGGLVRIAMDPVNIGYLVSNTMSKHANTNTTEMVSLGCGGDRLRDYKKTRYVVSDYGRAAVNADFKAYSVELADDTAFLDLEGHVLTVDEFWYPADDGEGGTAMRRLGTGSHSAAALAALGATNVADSSAGATGRVVVRGRETIMVLR